MSDRSVSSWSLVRFSLFALTIICVWWLLKRVMRCIVGCVTTYSSSFKCEKVDLCRWRLAFFRYLTKFEAMVVASNRCTAVWRVAQLTAFRACYVNLVCRMRAVARLPYRQKSMEMRVFFITLLFFVVPDVFISLDDHLRLDEGVARLL